MSVAVVGVGNDLIASKYFGSGSIVVSDMLKPAKVTFLHAN